MKKLLPLPSIDRLREILTYFPDTGELVWKKRISIRINVGDIAGSMGSDGYFRIGIDGKRYKLHRIAFLMGAGIEWPDDIDHVNGKRTDNSLKNLRRANRKINGQNHRKADVDSLTGVLGVTKRGECRYVAQISAGGKNHYLGTFEKKHEAHEAYIKAKRKMHKGCTL